MRFFTRRGAGHARLAGSLVWTFALVALAAHDAAAQPGSSVAPAGAHLTAAQMREDIAAFRGDFLGRDRSYSQAARAQAEARLVRLEAALDRTTLAGFELALAQVAALADNGHTNAAHAMRGRRYNRVPVTLATLDDDFRVLRAATAHADLLGARLVSVDGHALAELRDSARTLAGGTGRRRDRFATVLFESPEQLHAMGLAADAGRASYVFQTLDGRTLTRQLAGDEPKPFEPRAAGTRVLYPAALPAEQGSWRTLLGPSQAPWSLSDPNARFRWRAAPEIDGLVIELRQTFNAPGQPIGEFLAEMTRTIGERRPRNLVIDMRMNGGGDLNTARDFMKSLPTLVPGRIFALTSPWTFSAAISSIGYLEQTAPDRVTVVGEEVGDRLEFWAEGRPITLPRSGMVLSLATERHDYRTGCRPYTDCHGPVVRNPIAVPSLDPDIAAPWTIEAYRAGRDPAMEAVAAEVRRRR